ncbi:uncharacterized protein MEPE_01614 [Melanopsichium pennsylvanicum]|uniref:Uncharacterized protein n=2 Tax=Melanopsichium pennsylvanicum TaxID=63383 RepID=A0AAJ4XIT9_9BASI|nr:putative protein [Melanopsichium pennsylvanicum 4]SNX82908.1 uncharacterized protein MEPE_01614 [Melanopsichium pennsylvanicum]
MTTIAQASSVLTNLSTTSDDYVLDPRKSLPDYRREIYDLLQYLDEEQEKIDKQLSRFACKPFSSHKQTSRRPLMPNTDRFDDDGTLSETKDDEDDFVIVEDLNAKERKKKLLGQLHQLWRSRDALRKRAKHLNIRIDSLTHAKGNALMPTEDLGVDFHNHDDTDEL